MFPKISVAQAELESETELVWRMYEVKGLPTTAPPKPEIVKRWQSYITEQQRQKILKDWVLSAQHRKNLKCPKCGHNYFLGPGLSTRCHHHAPEIE